jgi:hypothetical protein
VLITPKHGEDFVQIAGQCIIALELKGQRKEMKWGTEVRSSEWAEVGGKGSEKGDLSWGQRGNSNGIGGSGGLGRGFWT